MFPNWFIKFLPWFKLKSDQFIFIVFHESMKRIVICSIEFLVFFLLFLVQFIHMWMFYFFSSIITVSVWRAHAFTIFTEYYHSNLFLRERCHWELASKDRFKPYKFSPKKENQRHDSVSNMSNQLAYSKRINSIVCYT